jgi:hypothetical protein
MPRCGYDVGLRAIGTKSVAATADAIHGLKVAYLLEPDLRIQMPQTCYKPGVGREKRGDRDGCEDRA